MKLSIVPHGWEILKNDARGIFAPRAFVTLVGLNGSCMYVVHLRQINGGSSMCPYYRCTKIDDSDKNVEDK